MKMDGLMVASENGHQEVVKREGKQKRLQIPSVISKLGSFTPYILNPTHTFRNTSKT